MIQNLTFEEIKEVLEEFDFLSSMVEDAECVCGKIYMAENADFLTEEEALFLPYDFREKRIIFADKYILLPSNKFKIITIYDFEFVWDCACGWKQKVSYEYAKNKSTSDAEDISSIVFGIDFDRIIKDLKISTMLSEC